MNKPQSFVNRLFEQKHVLLITGIVAGAVALLLILQMIFAPATGVAVGHFESALRNQSLSEIEKIADFEKINESFDLDMTALVREKVIGQTGESELANVMVNNVAAGFAKKAKHEMGNAQALLNSLTHEVDGKKITVFDRSAKKISVIDESSKSFRLVVGEEGRSEKLIFDFNLQGTQWKITRIDLSGLLGTL